MRRDDAVLSGAETVAEIVGTPARRVEHGLPDHTRGGRGQTEIAGLVAGIAQKQQMSVRCSIRIRESVTDQHTDGSRIRIVPVASRELVTLRMSPADVLVLAIDLARALQEGIAPEPGRI